MIEIAPMKKQAAAKEWLYFLFLVFVGFLLTVIFEFDRKAKYLEAREELYEISKNSKEYDFGSFESFSRKLENPQFREKIYSHFAKTYDLGDYSSYAKQIKEPSFLKKVLASIEGAFSIQSRAKSLFWLLLPYIAFQLLRSIIWATRTIKSA